MNRVLIVLLLIWINGFSQFKLLEHFENEKAFNVLHRPSKDNALSKFLKERITPEELQLVDFSRKIYFKNQFLVSFDVTKSGNPWNFRITTGNRALNKKLVPLLKEFLTTKIPNLGDLHLARNKIQLFSREHGKTVINASSVIVSDYPPAFDFSQQHLKSQTNESLAKSGSEREMSTMLKRVVLNEDCQSPNGFSDAFGCFVQNFGKHLISNFDYNIFKEEGILGHYDLMVAFRIDKKGKIHYIPSPPMSDNFIHSSIVTGRPVTKKPRRYATSTTFTTAPTSTYSLQPKPKVLNSKSPSKVIISNNDSLTTGKKIKYDTLDVNLHKPGKIENEIKRLVELLQPKIMGPALRNGIPFESSFRRNFSLFVPEQLTNEELSELQSNALTAHFKTELPDALVKQADRPIKRIKFSTQFGLKKAQTKVFFSFNASGKLDELWTDTVNEDLDKSIIKAFKIFPLETLNLDKSFDKQYSFVVIRERNGQKEVLCDSKPNFEIIGQLSPCNCKTIEVIKKQNFNFIEDYIVKTINATDRGFRLYKKRESDDKQEVVLYLRFNKEGEISSPTVHIKDQNNVISVDTGSVPHIIRAVVKDMPKKKIPLENYTYALKSKKMVFALAKS